MISIISPHYEKTNPYIKEAYQSLTAQTIKDWEWVIIQNNGGEIPAEIAEDERVKVSQSDLSGVGALKRFACQQASGDIIVELDSDDMLTPQALQEITAAFEDEAICFVYSNCAEFQDETWEPKVFSEYWGWKSRPFQYEGHKLTEMVAFPPSPHALRTIWWAPNHVRAWRTTEYWAIDGHNPDMAVADDHDLCCRFYLHGKMKHIDKCLYLYRLHDDNTWLRENADVQAGMWGNYSKYIIPMAEKWATENSLALLDLGAGFNKPTNYFGIDIQPGSDFQCDLNKGLPMNHNTVGVIRAYDILEHLSDPVHVLNECYRVLVPGGWLNISVPSTDGRGAFQDPTHISFFNENSVWYYTNPKFAQYVKDIRCKFQVSRVLTWYPSDWHKEHDISYVDAQLIAVKNGHEPIGECLWPVPEQK